MNRPILPELRVPEAPPTPELQSIVIQAAEEAPYLLHPALLAPPNSNTLNRAEKIARNDARTEAFSAMRRAYREDPHVIAGLRGYELEPAKRDKPYRGSLLYDLETLAAGYRLLEGKKEQELYPLLQTIETGLETYVRIGCKTEGAKEADRSAMLEHTAAGLILFHTNLRLPLHLTRNKYGAKFKGDPFLEDIAMAGIGALDRAVQLFDYRQGNMFSTFAMRVIERAVVRYVATNAEVVRLPLNIDGPRKKVSVASVQLSADLQRPATVGEIAVATGMKETMVEDMQQIENNRKVAPLADVIPDTYAADAHQRNAELNELDKALEEAFKELSPVEMVIISLRFGMYVQAIRDHYPSLPYDELFVEAVGYERPNSRENRESGIMGYKRLAAVLGEITMEKVTIAKAKIMEAEAMAKLADSEELARVARDETVEEFAF